MSQQHATVSIYLAPGAVDWPGMSQESAGVALFCSAPCVIALVGRPGHVLLLAGQRGKEAKRSTQGLRGIVLEVPQCHFCPILLAKESHMAEPELKE